MISAAQAAALREIATRNVEEGFPTAIIFEDDEAQTSISCARWSQNEGSGGEIAGLMATYDVAFRVRAALIPAGVKISEGRTVVKENGVPFRVKNQRSALGDPAIVLECEQC